MVKWKTVVTALLAFMLLCSYNRFLFTTHSVFALSTPSVVLPLIHRGFLVSLNNDFVSIPSKQLVFFY